MIRRFRRSGAPSGTTPLAALASLVVALAGLAPPLPECFKCCTVLAWYGTRAEVTYYKELFGL